MAPDQTPLPGGALDKVEAPMSLSGSRLLLTLALTLPLAVPALLAGQQNHVSGSASGLARARSIYAIDCAMCHGKSGDGKGEVATEMKLTLSDWSRPETLAGKSDQALISVIRTGRGQMPAEEPARAHDEELRSLVLYLRSFAHAQPAPPAGQ